MNRYQIYLDPKSVETFDDVAQALKVSRAKILRDAIDRIALSYQRVISFSRSAKVKDNPLLKMAGFARSPTGNVSKNIDEIYMED